MHTVIYVDMFLLINFLINYFLLLSTRRLSGAQGGRLRLSVAAGCGAVFALVILLPPFALPLQIIYKIATGAFMVLVAFKVAGIRLYLKAAFWFISSSFLLAGAILLCIVGFSFQGISVNNLAFSFNISPFLLFSCMLAVYSGVYIITAFFGAPAALVTVEVEVEIDDKIVCLTALYDTGFRLEDPLSARPVILAEFAACKAQLPEKVVLAAQQYFTGEMQSELAYKMRVLPFRTPAGHGAVPAFSSEKARIYINGNVQEVSAPLLALTTQPLEAGVGALVGPAIAQKINV